jgi:hypothetical protein
MNFTKTLLGGSAVALLATFASLGATTSAQAATYTCQGGFGQDTNCHELITFGAGGSITTTTNAGQGPYDGVEDTLFGVTNNTGAALKSFNINCGNGCFGFDGDGIDGYAGASGNGSDASGYGGPLAFFTNIGAGFNSGTVNFIGAGLADGASTYFSLEEDTTLSAAQITPVPEPVTLSLFGAGLAGAAFLRRRKAAKQA